ncbi:NAD(P)-dependent oxidoreductase [Streptomyces sp. Ru71]|uniref:SDR family NAD(P)-dependent oxidoreductase n=1 Tax=Streptomyces sp. Ru71 TaxID=2080746 RepID=UPI000CDD7CB3|nr:SDR family oxidoreductase [Streptomyces sp. Ru71]POX52325.1 NAD(P)-dependent oxidoreductase [Streptomyces sp. Ru71]
MGPTSTPAERVVLVTGEGDLAADVAASLLERGARVALAGPDADAARLAPPPGPALLALPCARDDLVGLGRAVDTVVERLGRLDHLVNLVAARPRPGPLMELDPQALHDLLHGGLVTPLACVQRAYRRWMAAHGGSVVNVAAATGRDGPQDAALAGLTELTEWLAAELAPRVDVHTLLPSPSLGPGAYRAGVPEVVCDLLTRRTNPEHGPVLVLSEEPACPSRAA